VLSRKAIKKINEELTNFMLSLKEVNLRKTRSVINKKQCIAFAFNARNRVRSPCVGCYKFAKLLIVLICRIPGNFVECACSSAYRAYILKLRLDLLFSNVYTIANLSKPAHIIEGEMSKATVFHLH
jgi:hypothetical protein